MYQTPLDRALAHYFVDSGSTWNSVADYLGMTPKALRMKRSGSVAFTARETHLLAELLDRTMDEVYGLMPKQSH